MSGRLHISVVWPVESPRAKDPGEMRSSRATEWENDKGA